MPPPSLCTRSIFLLAAASAFRPSNLTRRSPLATPRSAGGSLGTHLRMSSGPFPELVVFDLDACFWDQEMYTLSKIPTEADVVRGDLNGRGEGVAGVMSGRTRISLHAGSLRAMQSHHDGAYPGARACFASSADTPQAERIGRAALKLLEVVPGTTVWDLVVGRDWDGEDVNQIGRQPPLSANKSATHFPILRKLTKVRYDRMLFFDGKHSCDVSISSHAVKCLLKGPLFFFVVQTANGAIIAGKWRGKLERDDEC